MGGLISKCGDSCVCSGFVESLYNLVFFLFFSFSNIPSGVYINLNED